MSRLEWGEDRSWTNGVDHGVLYIDGVGIPWNGLISVDEVPVNEGIKSYYFDGRKTLDTVVGEDFGAKVTAFVYPDELDEIQGYFGLTYRVKHQLHLIYNVSTIPVDKNWNSIAEDIDPSNFAWDISTVPAFVPGARPTAHLIIDTVDGHPDAIQEVIDLLYGTDVTDPTLPSPTEIVDIFTNFSTFVVIDHGDGTWTATGPDYAIEMLDTTIFQITWPTAIYLDSESYTISSS